MSRKHPRSPEWTESDVEEKLLEVEEVTENSSDDEILVTKKNNVRNTHFLTKLKRWVFRLKSLQTGCL